ncbi:MAG TPA: hypothetical protein PLE19_18405 [Planctomycetota bacterium]|nr:hypothetical protein [Planctomycetota bacterium]HRT93573.1 hypothetical protein [Planctomycetota bacterium]
MLRTATRLLCALGAAACAAAGGALHEGVVELPKAPRTNGFGACAWSPKADAALVCLQGDYVERRSLFGGQQGYLLSAYFVVDAATGKASPLCRAHECTWLADGRLLARGYAPFDTPDVEALTFKPGPHGDRAACTILERDGRVVGELKSRAIDCIPSPDATRFLVTQDPAGRNNYHCLKKLALESLGGEATTLLPPVAERPGRLVGFRHGARWLAPDRFRIAVVDMDAADAARAQPGLWLNVTPEPYDYDVAKGAWAKLEGQALDDARADRYPIADRGEALVASGRITMVVDGKRSTLEWPEAAAMRLTVRAAAPDGSRLLVWAEENQMGKGAFGRDGGGGVGALPGAAPAPPALARGYYALDLAKGTKTRIEVKLDGVWNTNFSVSAYLEDGALLLIPDDAPAAIVDEATGRLVPFAVPGFPWANFVITRWAGVARNVYGRGQAVGDGRVAVLARQARFVATPHAVVVFRTKAVAGRLPVPEGFPLGERSFLHWAPDGSALMVTSHDGARVWLTRAVPGSGSL